jgi:hypothetical protein
MSRFTVSGVVAIALALLNILPAAAQPFGRGNAGRMPMMAKSIKGTIVSVSPSQIQISVDSKPLYVMIGQNTNVSVTGTAEPEYLKAGMSVEFVAEVAKGGAVKDKVDHLTLVTVSSDRPAGLLPPDVGGGKKGGKEGKALGNQDADAPVGGDAASPKTGRTGKSHTATPQFPGTFTVRGTLKMCKNGKITVAAARGPTVKAELADGATIDVDLADLRTAQRDDAVTVKGSQVRPGMIAAESVTIELANPLTGKKHAKPGKAAPPRGKAKDADPAGAAGAGN